MDSVLARQSTRSLLPSRQCCKDAMLAHRLYRIEQIAGRIRLHNIPLCPSIQSLTHHLRRIVLRNEENLKTGRHLFLRD